LWFRPVQNETWRRVFKTTLEATEKTLIPRLSVQVQEQEKRDVGYFTDA
jgi:hypothetical protein